MKTAISVPDDVFSEAEHLAKRLKISRSELYSKALSEYVSKHTPDLVTECLDRVCAEIDDSPDAVLQDAARRILRRAAW